VRVMMERLRIAVLSPAGRFLPASCLRFPMCTMQGNLTGFGIPLIL
jgi:hypothetical protein